MPLDPIKQRILDFGTRRARELRETAAGLERDRNPVASRFYSAANLVDSNLERITPILEAFGDLTPEQLPLFKQAIVPDLVSGSVRFEHGGGTVSRGTEIPFEQLQEQLAFKRQADEQKRQLDEFRRQQEEAIFGRVGGTLQEALGAPPPAAIPAPIPPPTLLTPPPQEPVETPKTSPLLGPPLQPLPAPAPAPAPVPAPAPAPVPAPAPAPAPAPVPAPGPIAASTPSSTLTAALSPAPATTTTVPSFARGELAQLSEILSRQQAEEFKRNVGPQIRATLATRGLDESGANVELQSKAFANLESRRQDRLLEAALSAKGYLRSSGREDLLGGIGFSQQGMLSNIDLARTGLTMQFQRELQRERDALQRELASFRSPRGGLMGGLTGALGGAASGFAIGGPVGALIGGGLGAYAGATSRSDFGPQLGGLGTNFLEYAKPRYTSEYTDYTRGGR